MGHQLIPSTGRILRDVLLELPWVEPPSTQAAAMAGVTGKQDQHLPGGQSSAGRISCLLSYTTCLHCQVKWASCVGRSHSAVLQELLRAEPPSGQPAAMAGEACEQTSTCWEEGVAGCALCTAGGSLRAALPVRGMEHLQLLRVSDLLG